MFPNTKFVLSFFFGEWKGWKDPKQNKLSNKLHKGGSVTISKQRNTNASSRIIKLMESNKQRMAIFCELVCKWIRFSPNVGAVDINKLLHESPHLIQKRRSRMKSRLNMLEKSYSY